MNILLIIFVLIFVAVLMVIEIPMMLRNKYYKDLWVFLIFLISGAIVQILKILKVDVLNPSDTIAWFFSPVVELIKNLLK